MLRSDTRKLNRMINYAKCQNMTDFYSPLTVPLPEINEILIDDKVHR